MVSKNAPTNSLKDKSKTKLDLPWRCALGQPCDSAGIGSIYRQIRGHIPILNVEYVEGLSTKLQLHRFAEVERLEE